MTREFCVFKLENNPQSSGVLLQDGVIQDQIPTVWNVASNEAGVNRDAVRQVRFSIKMRRNLVF